MIYIYKKHYADKELELLTPPIIAPNGGHLSLYGYDNCIIDYYNKNKSLYGFSNTNPVAYSEVFYVDFDDNKEAARECFKVCKERDYHFKVYDSGNRSIHFHIRRDKLSSSDLPYSDKQFAMRNFAGCDANIYRNGGMFRLPNTIHRETGKKKTVLFEHKGAETLKLDIIKKSCIIENNGEEKNKEYVFNNDFVMSSLLMGFERDTRNNKFFKLIKTLESYEVSREFIIDVCKQVNKISNPPMESKELDYILNYHLRS